MSIILLTGYSGLLGGALLKQLVAGEHEVVCLGRQPVPSHKHVRHVACDLYKEIPTAHLPTRADAIIHLAQGDGHGNFPEQAGQVFRVNVAATAQLLDWGRAAGIRHFIHASTGGVYGGGEHAFREKDELSLAGPLGYYLSTKRAAELLAAAYEGTFIPVALRYFFIYGAAQKSNMLMPRLVASVREGRAIKLAGQDGIKINPIHANDAATATQAALGTTQGGIFNVAGPDALTLRDIGGAIGTALGRRAIFETDLKQTPRHLLADITSMRETLGAPRTHFSDGIKELCV
jgi:UDP-glucose 4-epimerase